MIAGSSYIRRNSAGMNLTDLLISGDTVDESLSRLATMLATLVAEHDITQTKIAAATNADGTLKRAITY